MDHQRQPTIKSLIAVLLSLAALLVGGCADTREGKRYLHGLGCLIQRGDRIKVIEHKSELDFSNAKTGELQQGKVRLQAHRFDAAAKGFFQSAVIRSLDP